MISISWNFESGIWNPEVEVGWQGNMISISWNFESGIWNPEVEV
jgi:hypothetical protein